MTITRISLGPVNSYLLRTETGAYLIDSGPAESRKMLIDGIIAAGQDPKALRMLILTHGHSDHAGNAAWFQREYGISVAIHKKEAPYVEAASTEIPPGTSLLTQIVGRIFALLTSKSSWEGFKPNHLLDSVESLHAFGLEAKLMEFPGHTPGSIGLLLPDGELIAGDLVTNYRRAGLGMFACDVARMKQDIRSLETLGVRRIHPGHGSPFRVEQLKGI